jgi:hypothetical protein
VVVRRGGDQAAAARQVVGLRGGDPAEGVEPGRLAVLVRDVERGEATEVVLGHLEDPDRKPQEHQDQLAQLVDHLLDLDDLDHHTHDDG